MSRERNYFEQHPSRFSQIHLPASVRYHARVEVKNPHGNPLYVGVPDDHLILNGGKPKETYAVNQIVAYDPDDRRVTFRHTHDPDPDIVIDGIPCNRVIFI